MRFKASQVGAFFLKNSLMPICGIFLRFKTA